MFKIFLIITLVLLAFAIAQMMRVYELSSKLKGKSESEVSNRENRLNATLMLVFMFAFFAFVIWQFIVYGRGDKGPAASLHGVETDWLLNLNFGVIIPVFFITNALLFGFAFKYAYRKDRKATFFAHSNKLEMIWTVVPAFVLAVIIILGLKLWNKTMDLTNDYVIQEYVTMEDGSVHMSVLEAFDNKTDRDEKYKSLMESKTDGVRYEQKDQKVIQLYSKQFDWTARYAGEDNKLGRSDFKFIGDWNPLGLISGAIADSTFNDIDSAIVEIERKIAKDGEFIPDEKLAEMSASMERLRRKKTRIQATILNDYIDTLARDNDAAVYDDVVFKGTKMYLVKDQPYEFVFNSRDIIHSAYFPQFRAQMNCVPGITTRFPFTPTMTTEEFKNDPAVVAKYDKINRKRKEDGLDPVEPKFVLLCNKICGSAHSNMWIEVVVLEQDEFKAWMDEQKTVAEDMYGKGVLPEGDYMNWLKDYSPEKYEAMMKEKMAEQQKVENDTLAAPVVVDGENM